MKSLFIFLVISILSVNGISQEWQMEEVGNAFGGFIKCASVEVKESSPEGTFLAVQNNSDEIILDYNSMDTALKIVLYLDSYVFDKENEYKVTKILMSFDREKKHYILGGFKSNLSRKLEGYSITMNYALSSNYSSCLNKVDLANKFKEKTEVHFRIYTNNNQHDLTFPLSGSTAAINKTFKFADYKKTNNWTDFPLEALKFELIMRSADIPEIVRNNCYEHFEMKGEYYYLLVNSALVRETEAGMNIIFKDLEWNIVEEIPANIAFKNAYFFSGELKRKQNDRYVKNSKTIEIYYDNMIRAGIIEGMSLEQFFSLDKEQLLQIYNDIKASPAHFDSFRIQPALFHHYEIEEYTFEVFLEPFGI